MYAVIEDKGKQYKVAEGDRIAIDLRQAAPGDVIAFDKILLYGNENDARVGTPTVEGAKVLAEVEAEFKARKVIHVDFRRRQGSKRKIGHRQRYLRVRITQITAP